MTISSYQLRVWLERVARERLANRPDTLTRFIDLMNIHGFEHELVTAELMKNAAFGASHRLVEGSLIHIVDGFAKRHQTRPVPALPAEDSKAVKVGPVVKRKTLIDESRSKWPTIESDIAHASKNGLSDAARPVTGNGWHRDSAMAWARDNGRIKTLKNSVFSLPGKAHRSE
jgi:hypothetical protein